MSFRRACPILALIPLTLAACSQPGDTMPAEQAMSLDIVEAADGSLAQSSVDADGAGGAGAIAVAMPQIAYSYSYGFRLPAAAIKPLQERQADLCEAKGPTVCRIVSMEQAADEGDYSHATLTLAVAAPIARSFGKELVTSSDRAEGELVSSAITGEDLSKQIVDTEARLRARRLLRDRLMDILATRKGTVAQLVEAERSVAKVNEEIDQASSWLAEMRGRVNFSRIEVRYTSGSPASGGFADPIRAALGSVGGLLGGLIGFLILALTVIVPLGLLAGVGVWLWRRTRHWRLAGHDRVDAEPVA